MRAALAGIPILNLKWISQCIKNSKVEFPQDDMLIQTLPSKESYFMKTKKIKDDSIRGSIALGGVLALGAQNELSIDDKNISGHLFNGIYVHLCGSGWKQTPGKTKDVQLLLKESGATVLNSPSAVTKMLKKGIERESSLVLLCDGTINSVSLVFPQNMKDDVNSTINAKEDKASILVVNSKWFFDCISCAEILCAKQFKPEGSLVSSLWKNCLES